MSRELLLRILIALIGIFFVTNGARELARRQSRPDVAGFFSMLGGGALLIEALTLIGEFGVVGGVMILSAGIASAFRISQQED